MATGCSSILPQPNHGGRDDDAGCSTQSPPPAQGPWEEKNFMFHRIMPIMTRRTVISRRVKHQCINTEEIKAEKRLVLTWSEGRRLPSRGVLTLQWYISSHFVEEVHS